MTKYPPLQKHILGGVYGQALGDAWGMPADLRPQATWERYGGWLDRFYPGPEDHFVHHGLAAGQVTDDTEQAMALAASILERGQVTVEGVVAALLAWYESVGGDDCPFIGPSTRRAVTALRAGADPLTTGRYGDTDGAAMRVSPVGLVHAGNVEGAIRAAHLSCLPTHNTDVAVSGACAVAAAVAAAAGGAATLDEVIEAGLQGARAGLALGAPWFGASIEARTLLAVDMARRGGDPRERLQEIYDLIGAGLLMSECVPAAFGVLALAEGDPMQTASYAAALSGDADTVGAIACAIAGAWKGIHAFPADVRAQLDRANPRYDFQGTALALAELAAARRARR